MSITAKKLNTLINNYEKSEGQYFHDKEELLKVIEESYKNTQKYFPTHNPMAGHSYDTNIPVGSSYFYDWINIGNVLFFMRKITTTLFSIEDGKDGSKLFSFCVIDKIGNYVRTDPVESEKYQIVRYHGSLAAAGIPSVSNDETNLMTMVLTPEEINNERVYMLASVYPGYPDPDDEMEEEKWKGINEGDVLTGKELSERDITKIILPRYLK